MRCWTRPDLTWRCWKGCCWGCPSCRRRRSSLRRRPVLLVLAICLSSCVPRSLLANWLTGYLDHVSCWLFCSLPGDGVLAALAWPGFADVGLPGRDGHQDLAVRGDLEAAQAGGGERRGRGRPRRRAARCDGPTAGRHVLAARSGDPQRRGPARTARPVLCLRDQYPAEILPAASGIME